MGLCYSSKSLEVSQYQNLLLGMLQEKVQRDLELAMEAGQQQIVKDLEQLVAKSIAFKASLQIFELHKGGWTAKSLEAAATSLEQQIDAVKADR